MFNKKYKKDCNVNVGGKSGDKATNNLSKYVTDNNYLVRTLVFQVVDTNGIHNTTDGKTSVMNYGVRR